MTPTLITPIESGPRPRCSREQAARLLEELRAAYQSLSQAERDLVKTVVWQMERTQYTQEMKQEKECFA
jgi:FixJ family two-component response regulator